MLESLLVGIDVVVEVLFEQLVKGCFFRVPGSVDGGRFRDEQGGGCRAGVWEKNIAAGVGIAPIEG